MASRVLIVLFFIGYVHSISIVPLSCSQIRALVDGHNARRFQLAKGNVTGQPPASQMKYMVWDDELADKATGWADSTAQGHNPNRSLRSGRFQTGENIYWYWTTDRYYKLNPDQALSSWFDEHKNYIYGPINDSDFQRTGDKQVGHYTQMAWSDTTAVGCGESVYEEGGWYVHKMVCNYGPAGNIMGRPPYKTNGRPSGTLVCSSNKCNHPYGDRC